jgi:2,3-cyclic nucleotide 3-phosphodiesterase
MKALVLLRGCPGSGKSTLIDDLGLGQYTLCPDKLRLMYGSSVMLEDGTYGINQSCNKEVFDTFYKMLEYRMSKGEFTVIDATHCSSVKTVKKQISEYRKLAKRYNYRIYQHDMTTDLLRIAEQNELRNGTYSFVPHHIVDKMLRVMESMDTLHRDIKKIDLRDFIISYNTDTICKSTQYDKVKVIGDIHSCNSVLKDALEGFNDDTLYVFVGDYFDRGIEHYDTLKTIQELSEHKNVVLLEGNHEAHWIRYAHDEGADDLGYKRFVNTTLKDWLLHYDNEKDLKKELRVLYRKLKSIYFFSCGNKKYMVTHAGLTNFVNNALEISSEQCIKGVGGYDFEVSVEYKKNHDNDGYIQVFGHRGVVSAKDCSYSLEGRVEFGGYLRVLDINTDGAVVFNYENVVYNKNYMEDEYKFLKEVGRKSIETDSLEVNVIANSKLVRVNKCKPDMISLNFTDNAFRDCLWNNITIKARGLFVHETTGKVKARSYDKFFNLGQMMDKDEELNSLEYPIRVAKKENGFLGIISWDFDNDCFIIASKATTDSEYAGYVKENFEMIDYNIRYALRDILIKYRCSAVFEVIHPKDVHIVDYGKKHKMFLLDFVPNKLHLDSGINIDYEFSEKCRKEFSKIYEENPMYAFDDVFSVVWSATINDRKMLDSYIQKAHDSEFEGYVLTDIRGYMTKIKSNMYLEWKYCRTMLSHYIKGWEIDTTKLNDFEKSFYNFLRSQFIEDLTDKNIIEIREMYNSYINKSVGDSNE